MTLIRSFCYVRRWALDPSNVRPATLISGYIAYIRGWETRNYNSEARYHSLLCQTKRPPPSRRSTRTGTNVQNIKQEQVF